MLALGQSMVVQSDSSRRDCHSRHAGLARAALPTHYFESWLRTQAGAVPYNSSFIEYWLQKLIYYEAPFWVFTLAYTGFGLLVLWVWHRYPPYRNSKTNTDSQH